MTFVDTTTNEDVIQRLINLEQMAKRLEIILLTAFADKIGDLDQDMLESDYPLYALPTHPED